MIGQACNSAAMGDARHGYRLSSLWNSVGECAVDSLRMVAIDRTECNIRMYALSNTVAGLACPIVKKQMG